MLRKCNTCGVDISNRHFNATYCSNQCKWKAANDKKERKTEKRYCTAQTTRKKPLQQEVLTFIYGGLLGDMSINVNNTIQMTHTKDQEKHILWKMNKLGEIVQMRTPNLYTKQNGAMQLHASSIRHPDLKKIRNEVYPQGKKTIGPWIDKIDLQGLAHWYMDDGSFNRNKNSLQCIFSTESFGEEGNKLLQHWLKSKFSIESTVIKYIDRRYEKYRHKLILNKKAAKTFKEMITPYVHEGMLYKIK